LASSLPDSHAVEGTRRQVNKKIIRELLMTVDTLTNRMKWLEQQDQIRHTQIQELNTRNVNISSTLGNIRHNFTLHMAVRQGLALTLPQMNLFNVCIPISHDGEISMTYCQPNCHNQQQGSTDTRVLKCSNS
jgi:hypothetical protein